MGLDKYKSLRNNVYSFPLKANKSRYIWYNELNFDYCTFRLADRFVIRKIQLSLICDLCPRYN